MRSLYSRLKEYRLCLIAPDCAHIPSHFRNVCQDDGAFHALLDEIQRLRGRVYVQDGALPASNLDEQGRHCVAHDLDCWHMAVRDEEGRVQGAIRILLLPHCEYPHVMEALQVNALLERMPTASRQLFEKTLNRYIQESRVSMPFFLEAGGWALDHTLRNVAVAPITVATLWALCRALGGAMGIGAATMRHNSAAILKRFGGFDLRSENGCILQEFFDPFYQCEMQILGFASDRLTPTFASTVDDIQRALATCPTFTRSLASVDISPLAR